MEEMEFEVKDFYVSEDGIEYLVEYQGYKFYLQPIGPAIVLNFVPNLFSPVASGGDIQDDSYVAAYQELIRTYGRRTLNDLYGTFQNIITYIQELYRFTNPYFNKDHYGNDLVLSWLENPLVADGLKAKILDVSEWVYLVGNKKEQRYKIGMTKRTPDERVVEFSPKLPFETEILARCPTGNAYQLERELHEMFDEKRLRGEWFRLSDGDVIYIQSMSILETV